MDILTKANAVALELTSKYQNIRFTHGTVQVPYFINIAEQEYKKALKGVGVEDELIHKFIEKIKNGETALGSVGGKGSPEEIEIDVSRMLTKIAEIGYYPKSQVYIRSWMKNMHIGLDCSGYVYNIFKSIESRLNIEILKKLAWRNPERMVPSHAGAFIFDSDELLTLTDYNLQSLDIALFKDHTHVGIILNTEGHLVLADCSMGIDGISFFNIVKSENSLVFDSSPSWTRVLTNNELIFKRVML